jgi:hypothetical protein
MAIANHVAVLALHQEKLMVATDQIQLIQHGSQCAAVAWISLSSRTHDMVVEASKFANDGIVLRTFLRTWESAQLARRLTESTTKATTSPVIADGLRHGNNVPISDHNKQLRLHIKAKPKRWLNGLVNLSLPTQLLPNGFMRDGPLAEH